MVDPFAPAEAGSFSASGVRVRRRVGSHRAHRHRHSVCTPRFCTRRHGGVLDVVHDLRPEELSDELAVLLAKELDDIGVLNGQPEFELVFTGIVRSTVDGIMPAWLRFYRNSLDRLEDGVAAFARCTSMPRRSSSVPGSSTSGPASGSYRYGWPLAGWTWWQPI